MKRLSRQSGHEDLAFIQTSQTRPHSREGGQNDAGADSSSISRRKNKLPISRTTRETSLWRNERGVSAVEFALISSVLVFLLLAATDLALAIYTRAKIGNAARAGAEYAAIYGWNSSGISTAVTSATSLNVTATPSTYCGCANTSGVAQQTCGSTCTLGGSTGTYVSVTAAASYRPVLNAMWGSILTNNVLNMSATSVTRIN